MKQRIDPNVNLAGEMALKDLIVVWQVLAVGCLRVGNATTNSRTPSRLSGSSAAPGNCVDVGASDEGGSEERDLLVCTGTLRYLVPLGVNAIIDLKQGWLRCGILGSSCS